MPEIGDQNPFQGKGLGLGVKGGMLLSPEALQQKEALDKMKKLQAEEKKRFEDISKKVIKVLIQENVTLSEYPGIVKHITDKVNGKVNNFTLDKILK